MPENITTTDLQFALDGAVQMIITEMGVRSGEVTQRLDRIDSTLVLHGEQPTSGARAIAGFNQLVLTPRRRDRARSWMFSSRPQPSSWNRIRRKCAAFCRPSGVAAQRVHRFIARRAAVPGPPVDREYATAPSRGPPVQGERQLRDQQTMGRAQVVASACVFYGEVLLLSSQLAECRRKARSALRHQFHHGRGEHVSRRNTNSSRPGCRIPSGTARPRWGSAFRSPCPPGKDRCGPETRRPATVPKFGRQALACGLYARDGARLGP